MSLVLPREIQYTPKAALPAGTRNTQYVVVPSNGSSFSSGSIIYLDLPSVGYLVPESLSIRYNIGITNGATGTYLKGTPAYTPISRLDTLIGGQVVESIQQYNQVANMLVNTRMSYAQKLGAQYNLGYLDTTTAPTLENLNGATIVANAVATTTGRIQVSAPLGCILANAENLVPLGMMPAVRIQLTVDSIANMVFGGAGTVTNIALSNIELVYDCITFGDDVDAIVRAQADANGILTLKSQSFVNSAQTLAAGTTGQIELVYNQRLSSIKYIVANMGRGTAASNTFLDSVDITQNAGDYQFIIAGTAYPQRPLSTLLNKAGIFTELMQIFSPAHDMFSSPSAIYSKSFSAISSNGAGTSTVPGQFWVGSNLERLSTNGALLSGISSQLSPISFRCNTGNAGTAEIHTINLIVAYDALLQIDVNNRQCFVKQ